VEGTNGKTNGKTNGRSGHDKPAASPLFSAPPRVIEDLSQSCVRFVERAVNFKLDFTPETLPVLDHYVAEARDIARERPETIPLVAQAVGAYLGEVIRRKYLGFWRLEEEHEPRSFRVELEPVYLVLRPIEIATRALSLPPVSAKESVKSEEKEVVDDEEEDEEGLLDARTASAPVVSNDPNDDVSAAVLEVDEDDRAVIGEHLAALPPVPDTEFYSPSTQLEVVDLVVETIRAKRIAGGMEPDAHLEPDDYS